MISSLQVSPFGNTITGTLDSGPDFSNIFDIVTRRRLTSSTPGNFSISPPAICTQVKFINSNETSNTNVLNIIERL